MEGSVDLSSMSMFIKITKVCKVIDRPSTLVYTEIRGHKCKLVQKQVGFSHYLAWLSLKPFAGLDHVDLYLTRSCCGGMVGLCFLPCLPLAC